MQVSICNKCLYLYDLHESNFGGHTKTECPSCSPQDFFIGEDKEVIKLQGKMFGIGIILIIDKKVLNYASKLAND